MGYSALCKGLHYKYTMRNLCPTCGSRPVAVNYVKNGITHYRKQCDSCLRKGKKLKPKAAAWVLSGYKKKAQCEKCGFTAKLAEQLQVFHIDGKLKNTAWANLRTICANCAIEINKSKLSWKPGIIPDA